MNELVLSGCRPEPLASYLKALAVLRLVHEQADPSAQGCWRDDRFVLRSALDADQLIAFFVDRYAPTPIVTPWNGGSGFYDGDPTDGLDAIMATTDARFEAYRRVIAGVRGWSEMPRRFETLGELLQTLRAAADGAKGKKKAELDEHVRSLLAGEREAASLLGARPFESLALAAVEDASKRLEGRQNKALASWWKEVRKARTACLQLQRGTGKEELIAVCRAKLPDESLTWLDAAIAQRADGSPSYNPLLGSGGNEGRLDFGNNFMQRVAELLITGDRRSTATLLRSALLGEPRSGLLDAAIGQFDPGRAGGYNQGCGVETKDFKINPWDFVLALEGSCSFPSTITRSSVAGGRGYASLPFTVSYSAVGFSSSAQDETGKAEVWLPLWSRPTNHAELRQLLGEGRCGVGRRAARSGLDVTRAVASLGVDRGLESFERFSFLERRGKSYVAMPAGRLRVRHRPEVRLLDDLDAILGRLDGFLRGFPNVPASFARARRRVDLATYDCAIDPSPTQFASLLSALGQMEQLVAQRDRSKDPALSQPLLGLRVEWVTQCDDGGPEIRIAAALASIQATGKVGPLRSNLAGVDATRSWQWADGRAQRRWHGVDLIERLGNALEQRLMDAERQSAPWVPTQGTISLSARDVVPFLLGETDDRRLEDLLWGLTLVDWRTGGREALPTSWHRPLDGRPLPRGWCAMKLLHRPGRIRGVSVRLEPRIATLLRSRRTGEAVAAARHRLRVCGLRPLPVEGDQWLDAKRQLAGLLVPTRMDGLLEQRALEEQTQQSTTSPS